MTHPRTLIVSLCCLLLAPPGRADIIILESGRTLEGKVEVLEPEEGQTEGKVRLTTRYGSATLKASQVASIEYCQTFEEKITEALGELAAEVDTDPETDQDDAQPVDPVSLVPRYMELARECDEQGWKSMARDLYLHILTLDPDHFPAREHLGFRLVDGEWVTEDELMVAEGLVKHKGEWVHPDEIRADEATRYWEGLQDKVNRLVKQMGSPSPGRRARGYDQLIQLKDEIPGIVKAADQVRHYYEEYYRRQAAVGTVNVEIRATVATLGRPIPTFETTLATGSVFAPPTFVQIQIPELNVSSVETTVAVPVVWEEDDDEE
jgi:hypothetical protein